jgi:hypothetical protein
MSRARDRQEHAGHTYEDQMMFDYYDPAEEPDDRVTCKYCGTGGLHWQDTIRPNGTPGHALFTERNRKHECAGARPIADDFGVVE